VKLMSVLLWLAMITLMTALVAMLYLKVRM
jgi:hypothetical protein